MPGETAFSTQPIPVKPPPLGRVAFKPEDLVTAADTTAEHAKACADLVAANGGLYNAGPFTPWAYRADGAPPKVTVNFPGGLGGANWGGIAVDRRSAIAFVVSQDVGALGWVEKAKEGSPVPYDKNTPERVGPGRGSFDVRVGDSNWPCQKPPWGRLTAINAATGDVVWQVPLGITEQLPAGKQNTGTSGARGPDRHRQRPRVRGVHRRQPLPRARREDRKRVVGDDARAARQRQPDHLSGPERPAVCRDHRHRHAVGVRAASEVR